MKHTKYLTRLLLVAILSTTAFSSCIKDKFDEPTEAPDIDPNLEVNLTIQELKDLYKGESVKITEDYIISGVVVSDDQAGNVYQTLVIQDETGGVGFRVQRSDLFADFPFGRKVYVQVKGLWIGSYENLLQVGADDDGKGSVTLIPAAFVDDFFVKGPRGQKVEPLEISIQGLSNRHQNRLIKLKDVQFLEGEAGVLTFADAENKGTLNRLMEDCEGNRIIVRTSGYASFAGDVLPSGKGDFVGLYQIHRTDNQLLINKTSDLKLDGERCDGEGTDPGDPNEPTDPEAPTEPGENASLLFQGADFEDWNSFTSQITSHGIKNYATQAENQGFGGGHALAIQGTPGGNDYVFTIEKNAFPAGATKLSFYVKGTAGKSLSLNIYKQGGNGFTTFNVSDLTTNKLIENSPNNQYNGNIDTQGEWVLVTLDLSGVELNTSNDGSSFALKVGKDANYDLLIDQVMVW